MPSSMAILYKTYTYFITYMAIIIIQNSSQKEAHATVKSDSNR